jgi:GPI mannosyltransferase 3
MLILAIAFVSPELVGNVSKNKFVLRSCVAFFLGGLGVIIRFTTIAAFIPMGIILALRYKSWTHRIRFITFVCAFCGLLGIGFGMVVDRVFYGFWTIPFLANFHFNAILNFAKLYGHHPAHWYFTAGLPAITGLLLPFLLFDFSTLWRSRAENYYGKRNLWIILLCYVTIMSCNAHKEFRYILPILPLVCLLTAAHIKMLSSVVTGRWQQIRFPVVLLVFFTANVVAVIYLGLFHQSGPVLVNKRIVEVSRALHRSDLSKTHFAIHYLTGACHSSPLLSHLHTPPLNFTEIWHLDCSPECRADPDRICEYEQFASDVSTFMEDTYFRCRNKSGKGQKVCLSQQQSSTALRSLPDYFVTFSKYAAVVQSKVAREGFIEVARYPHSVTRIQVGQKNTVANDHYHHIAPFGSLLDITLDEVVLFAKKDVLYCEAD